MPSLARIALIEDDPQLRPVLSAILASAGYDPEVFENGNEFLRSRGRASFDVVVTDFQMEGASGMDILKACRAEGEAPEVLLVTGFASVRHAVEAMRSGAFDYLAKPVDPKELLHRVGQALEARRLKREVDALSGEVRRRHGLAPPIGESQVMREFLARARKAATSSSTVLILGRPAPERTSSRATSSPRAHTRGQNLPDAKLRRPSGESLGERALRPRARGILGRPCPKAWPLRGGERGDPLPR